MHEKHGTTESLRSVTPFVLSALQPLIFRYTDQLSRLACGFNLQRLRGGEGGGGGDDLIRLYRFFKF